MWVGKVSIRITTRQALHFFLLSGLGAGHPVRFGGSDLHRKQTFRLGAGARGLELSVRFLQPGEVKQSPHRTLTFLPPHLLAKQVVLGKWQ